MNDLGVDFTNLLRYNVSKENFATFFYIGDIKMKDYKEEFMKVIDESEEPEKVALYVLNLFLDYLGKSLPSQEMPAAVPPVSDR
jgi:hypothetical protein